LNVTVPVSAAALLSTHIPLTQNHKLP